MVGSLQFTAVMAFVASSFATACATGCITPQSFVCQNGSIALKMDANITDNLLKTCELGIYSEADHFICTVNGLRPLSVSLRTCPSEFVFKMLCSNKMNNIIVCYSVAKESSPMKNEACAEANHTPQYLLLILLVVVVLI